MRSVDPLTADSVRITFDVPEGLRDEFRFDAGQHLTVRTDLGGKGIRRNYSICSPATGGELAIAVKHIPGGAFSTFALKALKPGDTLELMTPTGRFGTTLDPLARKHYVAIAAGSGITPILSILRTTLEIETESRFTLIYGNRSSETTMFSDELARLESRYADRLELLHIHSRDPHHPPELSGRIDHRQAGGLAERPALTRDGQRMVPMRTARARSPRSRRPARPPASTPGTSILSCSTDTTKPRRPATTTPGRPSSCAWPAPSRQSSSPPATRSSTPPSRPATTPPTPAWAAPAGRARQRCWPGPSRWTKTSRSPQPTSTPAISSPASRIPPPQT